ncbi:MAG: VWA domain-containing protein [Myxococcaceae bacterium]|nr:VWA domain-containing protein [Myxococcaceae bacterium]
MSPWHFKLLGYELGFAEPWALALIAVAALIGLLGFVLALNRRRALTRAVPARLEALLAPGVSLGLPAARASLTGLGLMLFAFALAQPQCGSGTELVKRRGLDLVVAIDASKSMRARDVAPSRLERAKLELGALLDQLKGDRVAIVVFAGTASVQCPLTSDYGAARLFLRAIDPDAMPQGGTNIGAALLLAKEVFQNADRGSKDKVVVLISDGEDLGGEVKEGIDAMNEIGARVLAVGIGSELPEPLPILNKAGQVVGYQKDPDGKQVMSKLDRAGLTHIAEETKGKFFTQPRSVAVGEVVKIIDSLQKNELESRLMVRYVEEFQPFALAGLLFFTLGAVLPSSWWRRRA